VAKQTAKKTAYSKHAFFWRTDLSEKEMRTINDWIAGMEQNDRELLNKLLRDVRDDWGEQCREELDDY